MDEEWGTVCGSSFTDEMAGIACAAMNNSGNGECDAGDSLSGSTLHLCIYTHTRAFASGIYTHVFHFNT